MRIDCPGVLETYAGDPVTAAGAGAALCTDGAGNAVAWTEVAEFAVEDLDAERLSAAFAAGFVIVGTCWVIGKGVRTVLALLER